MTGETAATRALRVYPRSVGMQSAYVRGAEAALAGRPKTACPYKLELANTWRRSYRLAWMRGWYSIAGPTGADVGLDE